MDDHESEAPTWDHLSLQTAYPEILFDQWIVLPAGPAHSLDWSKERKLALALIESGKKIVWAFDLGLESPYFPLEDELRFQTIALALKQFTDTLWKEFAQETLALCLYRGSADFASHFYWTERQEMNFASWLDEEEKWESAQSRRLFTADAFAIYFQMLSHRLPDEVPIFLLFDLRSITSSFEALQIVSKQRFEHFLLARKDHNLPREGFLWLEDRIALKTILTTKGIVFPESGDYAARFDALLKAHPEGKVVFEAFLTEEWGELDQLIVLDNTSSLQGKRKLNGFVAAGGLVIKEIGLS